MNRWDELPADYDDIKTCPECGERDGLVTRSRATRHDDEKTKAGCKRCDAFEEGRTPFAAASKWNMRVILALETRGRPDPDAQLYRLLFQQAAAHEAELELREKVDDWLRANVVPRCPFEIGDRFIDTITEKVWSVREIDTFYGWNTGPCWILKTVLVKKSGKLDEKRREIWPQERFLDLLEPFWPASTWDQVVAGDSCRLNEKPAQLADVDHARHRAVVDVAGDRQEITTLAGLQVPTARVE